MGLDYLNMTLIVRRMVNISSICEDEVIVDTATGCSEVYLTLYHDAKGGGVLYQACLRFQTFAAVCGRGIQKVMVHFSVHTYSGDIKTYDFVYNPD